MNISKAARLLLGLGNWPALLSGVAPTVEHRAALAARHFATVIDVGANKGQFAYFAKIQWPDAHIHCFEPLPGPAARLRHLLGNGVTLHSCALGIKTGTADMHVASREDSSSLLALGKAQKDMFEMNEVGTYTVVVDRLDNVIDAPIAGPALLKIDVQGFEHEVLEGATGLLPFIDVAYVEASYIELYEHQKLADSVIRFLKTQGFDLQGTYNEQHDASGNLVQADLLFTPSSNAQ